MAKMIVSVAEIASHISRELEKHPACIGVEAPDVHWSMMESGCNWSVQIWKGRAASAEACEACIEAAVQNIRDKYNVFTPKEDGHRQWLPG